MQLNAITRKSALAALLLLVVILVVTTLRYALAPSDLELANSDYRERIVSLVMASLLYLCGGVVEGKMLPRSGLSNGYCTLPIPVYGVLACGIVYAPHSLATAAASLSFVVALYLLSRSLHVAGEKDSVLFASMLLGAMPLLYPPAIVLAGVIPFAILIFAFSLRQIVLMVFGYLFPLLAASYIMWYRGDGFLDLIRNFIDALMHPQMGDVAHFPYVTTIMLAAVAILLVWGGVYAVVRPHKMFMLTRVRRSLNLFVWILLLTLAMLFLPSCDLSVVALMAAPATMLLSFVLSLLPNNQSTVAYWILLLLLVVHLFIA